MVKCCYKCGISNKEDSDVTLFVIPTRKKSSKWQMEFVKRLGIADFTDKEIYLCSRHFNPADFEMKNYKLTLKENALPVDNDDESKHQMVIKPEIVYLKCHESLTADSESEASDSKELIHLEPLVEYVDVYEETEEQGDQPDIKVENMEGADDAQEGIVEQNSEYNTDETGSQVISVVSSEENNLEIEPMMPFFLTSSPVFTILNENNEVGETIILEIENSEDKKVVPPDIEQLHDFQNVLCKSENGSNNTNRYTCDICDCSYGCLNCLKSHYESLHINNCITQYKCKYSYHVSRSLVCPVCELMFTTRSETMDHYITHSVACEICGSGFDRQVHLTDHYRTAHSKGNNDILYECEICKTVYQYPSSLTKHYQTFHRMILCYVCKIRFASVKDLQEHEKVHRLKLDVLPFACSKCDKAFPKISDIAVHIRQDHKKETVVEYEEVMIEAPVTVDSDDIQMPVQKKVKVKK